MSFYEAGLPWNNGEREMHHLLHVHHDGNPTSLFLSPHAANILVRSPLVALGTLDEEGWPWTTLWGGEAGFSRPVAQSIIGLKTTVDRVNDPVLSTLLGDVADGEVVQEKDGGKMVGGLGIDLQTRRRVKLYGKSVAGAVSATDDDIGEVQLVVKIEQSLGNCPKYLNKKQIVPHIPQPKLDSTSFPLPKSAVQLLNKADLFFMSSSDHTTDMDTNHRGGPPGFTRILENNENGFTLVYPEYSGNRLYQSLGNLMSTPRAGLVFPDFESADVLYVTGETEILTGKDAADLIAHTNLAVKIHVKAYKFVRNGLAFRGVPGEYSPYNPSVRLLANENHLKLQQESRLKATLVDKTIFSPTIGRFRFQLHGSSKGSHWNPGQYVALDFSDELDIGYSHMREDDPKSLNDDYLRTFTVSSRADDSKGDFFEITIRKHGPVTTHLFSTNPKTRLEVNVQGFGGEFFFKQPAGESITFVAAGVGITPLLAQVPDLDLNRFRLYWTIRADDLPLVLNTFESFPDLANSTTLFVTGIIDEEKTEWKLVSASGAAIQRHRISQIDFEEDPATHFYVCTRPALRNSLLEWLTGKSVIYENFDY